MDEPTKGMDAEYKEETRARYSVELAAAWPDDLS